MSALTLERVSIAYRTRREAVHAVSEVSLELPEGRTLGLVGESGCGKSTLALAVLRLLPPTAQVSGAIRFEGHDLVALDEDSLRALRWRRLAYVPQSAMNSLVPVTKLRQQFRETWAEHREPPSGFAARVEELMRRVELDPELLDRYAHELSGGQRQRAIIAMSLLLAPALLIADEPTTGLDVIVQRQVIDLLRSLRAERRMSLIFISHDIGVVAELCDEVAVLYAGEVMESGPVGAVFGEPLHPYTMGLAQAFPDIRAPERALASIPGAPPRLIEKLAACAFAPRCPFAEERCRREKPAMREFVGGNRVACHRADEAAALRPLAQRPETWDAAVLEAAT
jgi:peptide/nickel transport system ATP-binding protein